MVLDVRIIGFVLLFRWVWVGVRKVIVVVKIREVIIK